jgi:hypothetical protein
LIPLPVDTQMFRSLEEGTTTNWKLWFGLCRNPFPEEKHALIDRKNLRYGVSSPCYATNL